MNGQIPAWVITFCLLKFPTQFQLDKLFFCSLCPKTVLQHCCHYWRAAEFCPRGAWTDPYIEKTIYKTHWIFAGWRLVNITFMMAKYYFWMPMFMLILRVTIMKPFPQCPINSALERTGGFIFHTCSEHFQGLSLPLNCRCIAIWV